MNMETHFFFQQHHGLKLLSTIRRYLILHFLIVSPALMEAQNKRYVESAFEAGYSYQPSRLIAGSGTFISAPVDLSLKIVPIFASSFSFISHNTVHKVRVSYAGWQHSVSYHLRPNGSSATSNSQGYWIISYNWGKLLQIANSDRFSAQFTAGPNLAIPHESGEYSASTSRQFNQNEDLILIDFEPFRAPGISLGLQTEALLKYRVYKSIRLQLGLNAALWFRPTYADRQANVFVNDQFFETTSIRSYKHIATLFLAISRDF